MFLSACRSPSRGTVDWDADRDWDLRTAADDSPEELAGFSTRPWKPPTPSLRGARRGEAGRTSVREARRRPGHFNLRWILVHMIEEYARHNGHADLSASRSTAQTGE